MKIARNVVLFSLFFCSQSLLAMQKSKFDTKAAQPRNFGWLFDGEICGLARPWFNADLKWLEKNNVGLVVTLTEEANLDDKLFTGTKLERLFLPIQDYSIPTIDQTNQFIAAVDKTLSTKKAVAVHCAAGNGRTGTMLACWLVARKKMDPLQAVIFVREKRPGSLERPKQVEFVSTYFKYVKDVEMQAVITIAIQTTILACLCNLAQRFNA